MYCYVMFITEDEIMCGKLHSYSLFRWHSKFFNNLIFSYCNKHNMISLENLCMIIRQKTISTFQGKAKLDHREKNVTSVVEDIKAFTSQNIAEAPAQALSAAWCARRHLCARGSAPMHAACLSLFHLLKFRPKSSAITLVWIGLFYEGGHQCCKYWLLVHLE